MPRRLLIAAGEAASGPQELPFGVRELLNAAEEILVVTPTLPTRFEWLSSATDKAREQADERLQAILGHLEEFGSQASGVTGSDDPILGHLEEIGSEVSGVTGSDDPIEALADAVRSFDPDHLVIALRSAGHAGWQESGLLERVLERFELPMTVFSVSTE